jgi:hypothetical protein
MFSKVIYDHHGENTKDECERRQIDFSRFVRVLAEWAICKNGKHAA